MGAGWSCLGIARLVTRHRGAGLEGARSAFADQTAMPTSWPRRLPCTAGSDILRVSTGSCHSASSFRSRLACPEPRAQRPLGSRLLSPTADRRVQLATVPPPQLERLRRRRMRRLPSTFRTYRRSPSGAPEAAGSIRCSLARRPCVRDRRDLPPAVPTGGWYVRVPHLTVDARSTARRSGESTAVLQERSRWRGRGFSRTGRVGRIGRM